MTPALLSAGEPRGRAPRLSAARLLAAASCLAASLAGCAAPTGDFGRPAPVRPTLANLLDHLPALPGHDRDAVIGQTVVEDELMMRLAHFRQTPPDLPPEPSARANALTDRLVIDRALSDRLADIRPGVADKARIRAGATAAFGDRHPAETRQGLARDARDRALFAEHCRLLIERTQDNRRLLERLVLVAPEGEVIVTERQLIALEQRLPALCGGDARTSASGRGTSQGPPHALAPPVSVQPPRVRKF